MRARNKRFVITAAQASISCEVSGWDALGISISNPTNQYLFLPSINDWVAPQSRGTFSLGGDPVVPVQWGAPPGVTQPAAITSPVPQQASIVLTDVPLPNAGGPITLNPSSLVSWLDGTEALPGLPNTNDLTMGLFRPGANRAGFSIAGVERFELGADYARFRDGTAANPAIGFLLETNTGLSRIGAGILGFSILGNEVARLTATSLTLAQAISANANNSNNSATSGAGIANVLKAPSQTVTLFLGDGSSTAALTADQLSADLRFNGAGVAWGDLSYFPNDGGAKGVFRFSTAGGAITTSFANASLGVGVLIAGTTPSTGGTLRVPSTGGLYARDSTNVFNELLIGYDAGNVIHLGTASSRIDLDASAGGAVNFVYAATAIGGGGGAALGNVGGAGPLAAPQNAWLKVKVAGVDSFIPFWR